MGAWVAQHDRRRRRLDTHRPPMHLPAHPPPADQPSARAGTWELGRKDRLYRNLAAARRLRGGAFDVVPRVFCLPADAALFSTELRHRPGLAYILKPVASSRGRGVRVLADPAGVDPAALGECLVQRYVTDPLLVNGRKFDLRIYVAVTSLDPLRVYVHEEGGCLV